MIADRNIDMSFSEFRALQEQLFKLGYELLKTSIETPGDDGPGCGCCGSPQVITVTHFIRKGATALSRGWTEKEAAQPFRLPLWEGRMFDICLQCWHVVEIVTPAEGEPDDN